MTKKRKSRHKEYVNHPRYGDKPVYSGNNIPVEEIIRGHWSYNEKDIFPETAIPADTEKQNYAVFPGKIYVDIEKKCVQCGRWFIFYAQEEKYWFETLSFYVDADCVKCVDCRKKEQEIKQLMRKYEELVKKENKDEAETKRQKNAALELYQLGYIRDKQKIDKIG